MRMNQDVKALWLTALRSGKYKQATGSLQTSDNKFCCLGVLCELAVEAGVIERKQSSPEYAYRYKPLPREDGMSVYGSSTGLFREVMDWAGIETAAASYETSVEPNDIDRNLVGLNDGLRHSFEQIADVVETQF